MAPTVHYFRGQKYAQIVKECRKDVKQFVDQEFTPDNSSLFFEEDENKHTPIVWKRACDIVDDPHLFVDGADINDITQGDLGNCWFVAACSALTHNKKLLDKVIPKRSEQEWVKGQHHPGVFCFQLWRFGRWNEIVIDDFLPTKDGQLIYGRSKTVNEFWSALLEKAFAKMYGCYEALSGGQLSNALVEVSGGVPENIDLSAKSEYASDTHARATLFYDLKDYFHNKALVVAAIKANSPEEIETALDCGLLRGHAYAVTNIHQIELDNKQKTSFMDLFKENEKIRMVRLHNPWGEKEWNGAWSDGSEEWSKVTSSQQKELGITVNEDGEFWMTWDDFCHFFSTVSVCHINTTGMFSSRTSYYESTYFSEWKRSAKTGSLTDRAGGCLNNKATFLCNPQYLFEVTSETEVNLSLSQKDFVDSVGKKRNQRPTYLTIGMHVMKVEDNREYRLHFISDDVATSQYVPTRSVFLKIKNLRKGRYVIVPTTFDPGRQEQFMLRICSPIQLSTRELIKDTPDNFKKCTCPELTEDVPSSICCSCINGEVCCVTKVKLIAARDLEDEKDNKATDPYVIIKCEGEKVQTEYIADTNDPSFDKQYVFYRKKPQKPLIIELWNNNYMRDTFLGRVEQLAPIDNECRVIEMPLGGKKSSDPPMKGTLTIELSTYDDPVYL